MAKYSFEFKKQIILEYLSGEGGSCFLAKKYGVPQEKMIRNWINSYKEFGPDALRPKKKGRKKTLDSRNKIKTVIQSTEAIQVDTSTEHIKELEDELLKLRIENAYLKELRRLRLEEEALLKKQRESSTVSEENSN